MAKLTVDFTENQAKVLDELASREEMTKAQVLRRAVALLNYYATEQGAGHRIGVLDSSGTKILKEIVTP